MEKHAISAVIDVVLSFALVALVYRSLTGLDKYIELFVETVPDQSDQQDRK